MLVLNPVIGNSSVVEKHIESLAEAHFKMPFTGRFKAVPETKIYTEEDKDIYMQKYGKNALIYEVYMDGVYICDVTEKMPPQVVDYRFLVGMRDAIESGDIDLDAELMKHRELEELIAKEAKLAKLREKKEEVEKSNDLSPTAKQAVSELVEEDIARVEKSVKRQKDFVAHAEEVLKSERKARSKL